MASRKKYLIKYSNLFLQQNQRDREPGLGLSLAYDIVKAHGGEIRVETKEEEGAEFVVELPGKQDDR